MAYANFVTYGALLTEILNKLRGSFNKFTKINDLDAFTSYCGDIDNFKIFLERRKTPDLIKPKVEYRLRILSREDDYLVFDDEGIDTNESSVMSLRELFHDVESYFNKKPKDKNKVLLEELLEKLGGK